MKKVLAIAILLLLVSTMAMAAADLWVLNLRAGTTDDGFEGTWPTIGVMPDATDGVDEAYEVGNETNFPYPNMAKWAHPIIGGAAYSVDFKSPLAYTEYPAQEKIWSFNVGSEFAAPHDSLKLSFGTLGSDYLPAADATFFVRLVNARGASILKPAWAGGGAWLAGEKIALAIPQDADPTYFGNIPLPELTLANGATGATLASAGYQFELVQTAAQSPVIPEPSSLMVLGTGLAGLVGLVSRRRRV